ncbi:hypothetical protein O1L60_35655 [Streptomyces diastatochromogenes]|nr:hypothetical protein [Streptomyces diastatochromogenes]
MKNVSTGRRARLLASAVAVLLLGAAGAPGAYADPDRRDCPAAEIFATDNTAVITDPDDPVSTPASPASTTRCGGSSAPTAPGRAPRNCSTASSGRRS